MAVTPALLIQFGIGAVGLFVLVKSAGVAVDRLLALAQHYDVPEVLIGMTVVAVGTSLPEIGSHVTASLGILAGTLDYGVASATVLGGNMGSSTAQQTLLFGLFLIGFGRFDVARSFLRASYVPMLLAFVLTLGVVFDGTVSRVEGGVLVVAFLGYTYYSFTRRQRTPSLPESAASEGAVGRNAVVAVGALVLVLVGAFLVLGVVQTVVDSLRLGGSMIGVVTLGLASALPELSTVVDSIRRRAPNLALGTLVGSNVVNPLVGIGLGGAISTYAVPTSVIVWDLPFKIVVGAGLLAYLQFVSERELTRTEGMYLVILYFVFVSGRFVLFPGQ